MRTFGNGRYVCGDYCRLLEEAEKRDARTRDGLTKMTVETTKRYRDFKAAGTKGINVGYNPKEQTVGIGESKRYLWETDRESGFWGGFRVLKQSVRCRCREMCGRIFKGRR